MFYSNIFRSYIESLERECVDEGCKLLDSECPICLKKYELQDQYLQVRFGGRMVCCTQSFISQYFGYFYYSLIGWFQNRRIVPLWQRLLRGIFRVAFPKFLSIYLVEMRPHFPCHVSGALAGENLFLSAVPGQSAIS